MNLFTIISASLHDIAAPLMHHHLPLPAPHRSADRGKWWCIKIRCSGAIAPAVQLQCCTGLFAFRHCRAATTFPPSCTAGQQRWIYSGKPFLHRGEEAPLNRLFSKLHEKSCIVLFFRDLQSNLPVRGCITPGSEWYCTAVQKFQVLAQPQIYNL